MSESKTDTSSEPSEPARRQTKRLFERKIARSRHIMLFERIWPRLWLPFGVAALFVIASSFALWTSLPLALHILALLAFAALFIASLIPAFRITAPTREEAIRELEKRSDLSHRPLSTLDDRLPSRAGAAERSLWSVHLKRARKRAQALQTGLPRPKTSRLDPYALRVPLILALMAVVALRPDQLQSGLGDAFRFDRKGAAESLRIDAWITPPPYTRASPILLSDGASREAVKSGKRVSVHEASEFIVRVSGASADTSTLDLSKPAGKDAVKITRKGDVTDMRASLKQASEATLSIAGRPVEKWQFELIADKPPSISLTKPPQASPRGALRLSYKLSDDYGIASASARISRGPAVAPSSPAPRNLSIPLGTPPTFSLQLPRNRAKSGTARTYKDLTAHPWAGLKVDLMLEAVDEAGKTGQSDITTFTLPARKFTKPMARAVIKIRRRLAARPADYQKIAGLLDTLSNGKAQSSLKGNIYLGLRSAYWRLLQARERKTIRSVADQLWDIALTIEDGNLSKAERDLRAAQDKLSDALNRNASPEEIGRLMKELRSALNEFMRAMAQNQMNKNQDGQQQQPGSKPSMTSRQLDQMLKNIENMARTGARDAARQMLSQLRDMLESLNNAQPQQSARGKQMRKSLDHLGRMIMQQKRLMEDTHRKSQQNQDQNNNQKQGKGENKNTRQNGDKTPERNLDGLSAQQKRLFNRLRELQRRSDKRSGERRQGGSGQQQKQRGAGQNQGLGKSEARQLGKRQGQLLDDLNGLLDQLGRHGAQIPQDLMRAGSHMGRAEQALGKRRSGPAGRQQGQALDKLRKGAQSLAEQMMRQQQGTMGRMGRKNRDPLGRPRRTSGPSFGDDVKVPDEIDTQRARDILRELRRRLGQSTRPPEELDYLERLIEQF